MSATQSSPAHPSEPEEHAHALLEFVLSMITPLISAAGFSRDKAFAAAIQAIESYRGPHLQSGQAAAFAMAALDNLRLAVRHDLPLDWKLKLRANANALSRNSQRHAQPRKTRLASAAQPEPHQPTPESEPAGPEPARPAAPRPAATPAPTPVPTTAPAEAPTEADAIEAIEFVTTLLPNPGASNDPERERDLQWATNMLQIARDHVDEIKTLPPAEHADQTSRIISLCLAAKEIVTGEHQRPGA